MLQKRDAFYGKGGGASAEIKRVNARLEKIRTAVDKKFPLAGEKETAFKENLRDHILQVYDLEHKAVTALDQTMR